AADTEPVWKFGSCRTTLVPGCGRLSEPVTVNGIEEDAATELELVKAAIPTTAVEADTCDAANCASPVRGVVRLEWLSDDSGATSPSTRKMSGFTPSCCGWSCGGSGCASPGGFVRLDSSPHELPMVLRAVIVPSRWCGPGAQAHSRTRLALIE